MNKVYNEKASYGDLKELTRLFSKNYPNCSLENWERITKNYLSDDNSYVFLCRKSGSIIIASCYIYRGYVENVKTFTVHSFFINDNLAGIKEILDYFKFIFNEIFIEDKTNIIYYDEILDKNSEKKIKDI